jgi:SAM-dependent methyltransferase
MEGTPMSLRDKWAAYIDRQHRYPTGIVGRLIGERMVRQHAPETAWSLELLGVRPNDRVLDLGCGAGQALALAAEQAPLGQVAGVDLSTAMLASAARRNRRTLGTQQLVLVQAAIEALPFTTRSWNKVLSIHTFYFWPDQRAILLRLTGLLTPHGVLVVTFATARTRPDGEREFWPLHARADALVRELRGAGLSVDLVHGPDSRQYNNVAIVVQADP